jgi:diguanylate cyclase (GGDEF)-like protein
MRIDMGARRPWSLPSQRRSTRHSGAERDLAGVRRDEIAELRDEAADERDRAASQRDVEAELRDEEADARDREATSESDGATDHATALSAEARREAASDRRGAARDRKAGAVERGEAEKDRSTALDDRDTAATDLLYASLDGLTGVYTRAAGLVELKREVDRSQRTSEPLVLLFVDVDGLKAVNDAGGHVAGDRLLVRVAQALETRLRPYDVVVRYGGDEFVCALAGASQAEAERRLESVRAALADHAEPATMTAGLSELRANDTVESLVGRADDDLYRQRRGPATQATVAWPMHFLD